MNTKPKCADETLQGIALAITEMNINQIDDKADREKTFMMN